MIFNLFRKDPLAGEADALFVRVAEAARQPVFYTRYSIPDTVEGRFEVLSLHVFLLTARLERLGETGKALAQAFIDRYFASLDDAMRTIGIGDTSVGKKVKAYARNFYGRVEAYSAGLLPDSNPVVLEQAIERNLFGGDEALFVHAATLAAYIRQSTAQLATYDLVMIRSEMPLFATEML